MSHVQRSYRVCDWCNGAIPVGADYIFGVSGQMIFQGGERGPFADLDFCCSEHLMRFLAVQPTIPTPDPLYQAPPVTDAFQAPAYVQPEDTLATSEWSRVAVV